MDPSRRNHHVRCKRRDQLERPIARRDFAVELKRRGARVRMADVPAEPGVNGPDDYVGRIGDEALWGLLDNAIECTQSIRGDSQATTIVRLVTEAGGDVWHSTEGG